MCAAKFVKVFPNEYKRALGELYVSEQSGKVAAKKQREAA